MRRVEFLREIDVTDLFEFGRYVRRQACDRIVLALVDVHILRFPGSRFWRPEFHHTLMADRTVPGIVEGRFERPTSMLFWRWSNLWKLWKRKWKN